MRKELSNEKKINLEKIKIINFIYKKLSLHTHPDKTKDNQNFIKLKRLKENKDFSGMYYFLLKFNQIKIKNKILLEIKNKNNFNKLLVEEINILTYRINNMRSNSLWEAFFHSNKLIRDNLKNKILNLLK
jgi:hypothetical protein